MTVEERSYAAYRKLNLIFGFSGHFVFPYVGFGQQAQYTNNGKSC